MEYEKPLNRSIQVKYHGKYQGPHKKMDPYTTNLIS